MILEKFTHIGKKVKAMRMERELSVAALAGKAAVQESMITNVENFRHIPDLLLLNRIAKGLDISLPELVDDLSGFQSDKPYILLRREDRERFDREDSTEIEYEVIMTKYINSCLFTPTLVTIRTGVSRPPVSTNALEFVLVLSGTVITGLDDEAITLHEGDALFYDARMPHFLQNSFDRDCTLLSIYLMHED